MACEIVKSGLNKWVEKYMSNQGVRIYHVELLPSDGKNDGYLGDITFIKITYDKTELNLVAKSGKPSQLLRKQAPVHQSYQNEINIYRGVLAAFDELQMSKFVSLPFRSVPKFFGEFTHDGIEFLLLENLNSIGFKPHARKETFNLEHLKITFREYGRYNALSFALRKHNPTLFNKLSSELFDFFKDYPDRMKMIESVKTHLKDIRALFEDEPKIQEALKEIEDNAEDILANSVDTSDPNNVIVHGDCWSNNFMFKYKDGNEDRPEDVRIIDFQVSRLASPVYDLSFHLFICASETDLNHFDTLMKIYHDSLISYGRELDCDINGSFPYETLMDHWRKYSKYGLITSIFVLKFVLSNKEEGPKFNEVSEDCTFEDMMVFEISDKDIYNKRIRGIVHHFFKDLL